MLRSMPLRTVASALDPILSSPTPRSNTSDRSASTHHTYDEETMDADRAGRRARRLFALSQQRLVCREKIFKFIIAPARRARASSAATGAQPASATDPIFFAFDRKLKLTSLKVIPVSEIETNKYPHPIWHLVSKSNSVPDRGLVLRHAYPQACGPPCKGATPDPLEPGVPYRLLIEAGKLKAEHDFVPVPKTP